jgi:putative transposase
MAKTTLSISEAQLDVVTRLSRGGSTRQALARRCAVVLQAAAGMRSPAIASKLGIEVQQVRRWRTRWEEHQPRLLAIEAEIGRVDASDASPRERHEARVALEDAIEEVLWDAPRPGAQEKFTTEHWCAIIEVACMPPQDCGRPISHWTARELRDEVVKRGIVPSISVRHLARFFGGHGIQAPQDRRLDQLPGPPRPGV